MFILWMKNRFWNKSYILRWLVSYSNLSENTKPYIFFTITSYISYISAFSSVWTWYAPFSSSSRMMWFQELQPQRHVMSDQGGRWLCDSENDSLWSYSLHHCRSFYILCSDHKTQTPILLQRAASTAPQCDMSANFSDRLTGRINENPNLTNM